MTEKIKKLMNELGVKGEIINHPEVDGTHSDDIANALNIPIDNIIKCLILKSKKKYLVAAIILGNQRLSFKKLEKISGYKKFSFASEELIKRSTGFQIGGIPPIAVHNVMPVFVDSTVLLKSFVIGSAGTPFAGLKIAPKIFNKLNYIIGDIHSK